MGIVLVLFYLFVPLLVLHFCHRYRFVNKIGAVVITYILGFVVGNTGILPHIEGYANIQNIITIITIPLAIPLMLFSMNLRGWYRNAGKVILALVLGLVAVVTSVYTGYFVFSNQGIDNLWDVSAMLIGLYTGGTPNLAAIQLAIGADQTQYMVVATYDVVIGAIHLLFVMTIAQKLFHIFLPRYQFVDPDNAHKGNFDGEDPYWGMLKLKTFRPLLKALGVAIIIFGIGGAATLVVPESSQMAVVILIITTLGILASLIPRINKIEKSFELGMYFILIFCVVVASMADLRQIDFSSVMIGVYIVYVILGSLLIHAILSRIFKVDTDTFIITSTAFICSPPFVPVVAGALRNREIIFPGITVGIIGYAIGNYLGVVTAWALEWISKL